MNRPEFREHVRAVMQRYLDNPNNSRRTLALTIGTAQGQLSLFMRGHDILTDTIARWLPEIGYEVKFSIRGRAGLHRGMFIVEVRKYIKDRVRKEKLKTVASKLPATEQNVSRFLRSKCTPSADSLVLWMGALGKPVEYEIVPLHYDLQRLAIG